LDGQNVILVDAADGPDGPRVVGTLLIDSAFPADRIEPVLRRSQKIIDFVRCDVRLASESLNKVAQKLCSEIMKWLPRVIAPTVDSAILDRLSSLNI
jgi:hypothetical protein